MKSKIVFGLSFLILASGLAFNTSAKADEGERIFESGLFQLRDIFNNVQGRIREGTPYRDVKKGCVGDVFLEWQSAYLEVMKRTPLTLSTMALEDYGQFMVSVDAGQRMLNTIRAGMIDRIHQTILERRANDPNYPKGAGTLVFTGEDIHRAELTSNIRLCADDQFAKSIDDVSPPADLRNADLRRFKVTWKQSTAGGIEAEWTQIGDGGLNRLLFFGVHPADLYDSLF